MTERRAR